MTAAMRVLVADDEQLARNRLVRLLAAMNDVVVVGQCESGRAVLDRIKETTVDVVLLDIHMPGLSGLETAELFPENGPAIVLCTAHPDHALAAFELGAADYVMKPIEAGRLKRALARAREKLVGGRRMPAAELGGTVPSFERLAIPTRQGIVLVDPREVSHAVLDGELVSIATSSATYLSDQPLGDLQERLPRELFERVHRRALLNLAHVVRLEPNETGGFVAHTRGGCAVEVSRQAARELRKRLGLSPHRA
jgi:two-component system LytT family response regulator